MAKHAISHGKAGVCGPVPANRVCHGQGGGSIGQRNIIVSRFGVIPKSQPGKFRLILDLSSPHGGSVNGGIDRAYCSTRYATVDEAAEKMATLGRGALMAKLTLPTPTGMSLFTPMTGACSGCSGRDKCL